MACFRKGNRSTTKPMDVHRYQNWNQNRCSQNIPVGFQNRTIINKKLDELHRQNKMQWIKNFAKYGYPVYIVWRTVHFRGKQPEKKVVVDIRNLNKITEKDVYFMPLQSNIFSAVQNTNYITVVNYVTFFH